MFLLIDFAFLASNLTKFFHGAWFPILIALVAFTLMRTWRRGRQILAEETRRNKLSLELFIRNLKTDGPLRVSGTAIFLTTANDTVPEALLPNLKHNIVLHERNIFLTIETLQVPLAEPSERVSVIALDDLFYRVTLRFGFMEDQNVPRAMPSCNAYQLDINLGETTFFASRENIVAVAHKGMPVWRDKLFAFMLRNTVTATSFFKIPGNRLVELGTQVEI